MQKNIFFLLSLSIVFFLGACKQSGGENAQNTETTAPAAPKPITLSPVSGSPEFSNAAIALQSPKSGAAAEAGKVAFDFDVKNYQLGSQTPDAAQKMCSNSDKGQHIHLILNNQPYDAYYTDTMSKVLEPNYYVGLAFLSRSYHESIKNKEAYQLFDFTVGKPAEGASSKTDLKAPHLFYSRPKGNYVGKGNIEKILLDFYLTNCDLSNDGYKVRATINGTQFLLNQWQPYFIENLPIGDNTIKLELLDKTGNLVPSPFNPVERKIGVYEQEPLVK
ncbi:MAG: phosphopeptide-binding protein [Sphingobacteriales bacterium]|nr:phosphopeptide-binding protein [Sphingobacteriales bacterium]